MGGAPQSESNFVLALPTAFIIETGRHIYFSTGPGKAEVSRNKVELPRNKFGMVTPRYSQKNFLEDKPAEIPEASHSGRGSSHWSSHRGPRTQ